MLTGRHSARASGSGTNGNNLNVAHIIIAIFVVGIVGLLLEQMLIQIAKRFTYEAN